MFVHFGLYSVYGCGEWGYGLNERIKEDYFTCVNRFKIRKDWAKKLVKTAKNAGCKYINITTRHHEGFSLYDTCGLSDFDAPHSACGRDLIREFVDECNAQGIIPFFYHTCFDWHYQKEYCQKVGIKGFDTQEECETFFRESEYTTALSNLTYGWLSELPGIDLLLFRYMKKVFDAPTSIETNFADSDVLELSKVWKKVNNERHRLLQFVRFQKASDGTFFAPVEPLYNVLPLTIAHFKDRFADQPWLIYDIKRKYGFYYNLKTVEEVTFEDSTQEHLISGMLDESMMDQEEHLFQDLWKTYFKAICIKERLNPRKHKQDMPMRYWKLLTEKQN